MRLRPCQATSWSKRFCTQSCARSLHFMRHCAISLTVTRIPPQGRSGFKSTQGVLDWRLGRVEGFPQTPKAKSQQLLCGFQLQSGQWHVCAYACRPTNLIVWSQATKATEPEAKSSRRLASCYKTVYVQGLYTRMISPKESKTQARVHRALLRCGWVPLLNDVKDHDASDMAEVRP